MGCRVHGRNWKTPPAKKWAVLKFTTPVRGWYMCPLTSPAHPIGHQLMADAAGHRGSRALHTTEGSMGVQHDGISPGSVLDAGCRGGVPGVGGPKMEKG